MLTDKDKTAGGDSAAEEKKKKTAGKDEEEQPAVRGHSVVPPGTAEQNRLNEAKEKDK